MIRKHYFFYRQQPGKQNPFSSLLWENIMQSGRRREDYKPPQLFTFL